jgi:hypothetical protein
MNSCFPSDAPRWPRHVTVYRRLSPEYSAVVFVFAAVRLPSAVALLQHAFLCIASKVAVLDIPLFSNSIPFFGLPVRMLSASSKIGWTRQHTCAGPLVYGLLSGYIRLMDLGS